MSGTIALPPFDLNAAHMQAHRWVEIARPLIKAYLALGHVQSDILVSAYEAEPPYRGTIRGSANDIACVLNLLREEVEGIRDQWIADLSPPAPNWGRPMHECSPEVIDYDDLCEMWEECIRDVLSVDGAIDREARK